MDTMEGDLETLEWSLTRVGWSPCTDRGERTRVRKTSLRGSNRSEHLEVVSFSDSGRLDPEYDFFPTTWTREGLVSESHGIKVEPRGETRT